MVTSVVGLHQGKCGPRRVVEIQRAVEALTAAELAAAHRCHCMYATQQQIVAFENLLNRSTKPSSQMNVITISLAAPIVLPNPKSVALKAPTVQIVAKGLPGYRQTIIWLGHEPERVYHGITFSAYMFAGDPFNLTRAPGRECAED